MVLPEKASGTWLGPPELSHGLFRSEIISQLVSQKLGHISQNIWDELGKSEKMDHIWENLGKKLLGHEERQKVMLATIDQLLAECRAKDAGKGGQMRPGLDEMAIVRK